MQYTSTSIIQLLLAISLATSINALIEPINLKKQLKVLRKTIDGEPLSVSRFQIDPTVVGSLLFGLFAMSSIAAIIYFLLGLLPPNNKLYLMLSIGIIVGRELVNRIQIDRLHARINDLKHISKN